MFERNKVENFDRGNGRDKVSLAVEMALDDGRTLTGQIIAPAARGLSDVLNANGGFVEFEAAAGDRTFLAKSSIRSVKPRQPVRFDQLERKLKSTEASDPYQILGVNRADGPEAVREAYLKLAKAYHPDRLQGLDLPREMLEYGCAMAKRVNAAYAAVSEAIAATRPAGTSAASRTPAASRQ
ncbi:MAG: J domain-containing protein [Hyphomicrobiaceae bacterium]|nr:MAG: J domain-containing protein [Hyphomicrobiaceae bacterium]